MRTPKYQPYVVSYFDILGFKALLDRAGSNAGEVAKILELAKRYSRPDDVSTTHFGWKFTNFSDLVVRTIPILHKANRNQQYGVVFHEIYSLAAIQTSLIARGILIRGAVTLGFLIARRELLFGPGLVRAYTLESKKAVNPRIILDPELFDAMKLAPLLRAHSYAGERAYIVSMAKKDVDGLWFVDYLKWVRNNADDVEEYVHFLERHRELVAKQLRESAAIDGRTKDGRSRRSKAKWLCTYHNAHVRDVSASWLKQELGLRRSKLFVRIGC